MARYAVPPPLKLDLVERYGLGDDLTFSLKPLKHILNLEDEAWYLGIEANWEVAFILREQ